VDAYRSWGHDVQVLGVLGSPHYGAEDGFLSFPGAHNLARITKSSFLLEDYSIGRLFEIDSRCYRKLSGLVEGTPEIIHVEQPWLVKFADRYRKEFATDAKILYGSQNIEYRLKEDILKQYVELDLAEKLSLKVKRIEIDAINASDAIICVSESDLAWVKEQADKPVALAQNGVNPWGLSEIGFQKAKVYSKEFRYALYCASAHPPNLFGFLDMFGGGFGSLKPDERLIVAGGVGTLILGDNRFLESAKLAERVLIAGQVDKLCLDGLLNNAHCIVLPLTMGGGTNLKTAEAILSCKYVVATTKAMRGFEHFIGESGIYVADSREEFKRALRFVMGLPALSLTEPEVKFRKSVLWANCLNTIPGLIDSIVEKV
jgi:hypothetical protein